MARALDDDLDANIFAVNPFVRDANSWYKNMAYCLPNEFSH